MRTIKTTKNLMPKRGTVADWKRQREFENREIPLWQGILEGVTFAALFAIFILLFAVM